MLQSQGHACEFYKLHIEYTIIILTKADINRQSKTDSCSLTGSVFSFKNLRTDLSIIVTGKYGYLMIISRLKRGDSIYGKIYNFSSFSVSVMCSLLFFQS